MLPAYLDAVVLDHAKLAPPALVRSVIENESSGDPDNVNPKSGATGLMQIVRSVLKDYNLAHGETWTMEDMKDPDKNLTVGVDHLERIAKSLSRNHPSLPLDFGSRRFVELVILGWVNGYSEAGGVGNVVGKMEAAGVPADKITADSVAEMAPGVLPNTRFSAEMPAKVKWAKKVANDYFRGGGKESRAVAAREEPERETRITRSRADVTTRRPGAGMLLLGIGVPLVIVLAGGKKRRRK